MKPRVIMGLDGKTPLSDEAHGLARGFGMAMTENIAQLNMLCNVNEIAHDEYVAMLEDLAANMFAQLVVAYAGHLGFTDAAKVDLAAEAAALGLERRRPMAVEAASRALVQAAMRAASNAETTETPQ